MIYFNTGVKGEEKKKSDYSSLSFGILVFRQHFPDVFNNETSH